MAVAFAGVQFAHVIDASATAETSSVSASRAPQAAHSPHAPSSPSVTPPASLRSPDPTPLSAAARGLAAIGARLRPTPVPTATLGLSTTPHSPRHTVGTTHPKPTATTAALTATSATTSATTTLATRTPSATTTASASGSTPSSTNPTPSPVTATGSTAPSGWGAPIASDEFNGTAVDTSKWGLYSGPGNGGNGTRSPSAFSEGGGVLTITGSADDVTGGMSWIATPGTRYGRYEVRMRAFATGPSNGGHPYHPVLIQWPDSDAWPSGGEYDFAETDVSSPAMEAYMHHPDGTQDIYRQTLDLTQWHDYAFEWSPGGLTGWIDGVEWFHDTDPAAQAPGPMHQTIQLDSNYPGTQQPAQMQVDWYRAYAAPTA